MSGACGAVSLQFACSPASVWEVLTDRSRYGEWYGYPRALEITDIDSDFMLGGKIRFKGISGTAVITAFEPEKRLAISTGSETNEFVITSRDSGCAVTMQTSLNGHLQWNGTERARERANLEMLRRLRRTAATEDADVDNEPIGIPVSEPEIPTSKRFFSNLALGYRNPLPRHQSGNEGSVELARLIDNTEADVVIHRRAAIAGIVFAIALLAVVLVSASFPMSSVVPSSGLSVIESVNVDKAHAEQIYIGQRKSDVELLLSCAGIRTDANEYSYSSVEGSNTICVIYDAYGRVRRFAFTDADQCNHTASLTVHELNSVLSGDMTVSQVEKLVGLEVSSFKVDKSQSLTMRFGKTELERGVFDSLPCAQLEITLNVSSRSVDVEYYYSGEFDDELPSTVEGDRLQRQYSNDSFYAYDRAAYYRAYMICGLSHEQVDALLGSGGSESYADRRSVTVSYMWRNPASDEAQYRCRYDVTYDTDGIAQKVTLRNNTLFSKKNVLLDLSEYNLDEGMTLNELEGELQILPTWLEMDSKSLTLGYGTSQGDYLAREISCELMIRLSVDDMTVTDISF